MRGVLAALRQALRWLLTWFVVLVILFEEWGWEPLERLASQLSVLKQNGPGALPAYVRNVKLALFEQATQAFVEVKR